MKTVKLHNGKTFKASASMSDAEIARAVKSLMQRPLQEQKPQEVKILNIPEFPAIPEVKDYTSVLKEISKNLSEKGSPDLLKEVQNLNKSIGLLSLKIERQTTELVKVMTMQADVMAELVVAYREPKKIMRDAQGRPEGIKNEGAA